jgi:hypothetical protein
MSRLMPSVRALVTPEAMNASPGFDGDLVAEGSELAHRAAAKLLVVVRVQRGGTRVVVERAGGQQVPGDQG